VSAPLPRIRLNLDFLPSPAEDRPGLLIRDSQGFSDSVLIVPPPLVACLQLFDGQSTELDLKAALVEITGELDVSAIQKHLLDILSEAGFLHDDVYAALRDERQRAFAEAPVREAAHAGSAYPADEDALRSTLTGYLDGASGAVSRPEKLIGVAAPHVSPFGGVESYRAAYTELQPDDRERTFVVLGTSHYGQPNRFGVTRKPYATPFGATRTEPAIIERLAQQPAAIVEDYCHATEHSIEFQVVFLQHIFGTDIRVVPLLCGSFAESICGGGQPEDDDRVRRFLGELGEIAAAEGDRLLWVLGIDMAHMGARYGDPFAARAREGEMVRVEQRDHLRIERINQGDAAGFWELVQENEDDLRWCGSSPLYTFLKAVPGARGRLLDYQHWNIDEESVVSFGAMAFTA
jgi:MEMO1 family protein